VVAMAAVEFVGPGDQAAVQRQVDQLAGPHGLGRVQAHAAFHRKAAKASTFVPQRIHSIRSLWFGQPRCSITSSTNLLPKNASKSSNMASRVQRTARLPRQPKRQRPNSSVPIASQASSDRTVL